MIIGEGADGLAWGCYPMVPYAGRVRDARLEFAGRRFDLPRRQPPHAIHGTVFEKPWTIEDRAESRCRLTTDLQPGWPFAGRVEHEIELHPDRLVMRLTATARETMPIQLGWHPWFVKPNDRRLAFARIHRRDAAGIASHETEAATIGPDGSNDDCFSEPDGILRLTIGDRELVLSSSCRCWVVYDEPRHATCVEPQSGPPNGVNDDPFVLVAGRTTSEDFTISWSSTPFQDNPKKP